MPSIYGSARVFSMKKLYSHLTRRKYLNRDGHRDVCTHSVVVCTRYTTETHAHVQTHSTQPSLTYKRLFLSIPTTLTISPVSLAVCMCKPDSKHIYHHYLFVSQLKQKRAASTKRFLFVVCVSLSRVRARRVCARSRASRRRASRARRVCSHHQRRNVRHRRRRHAKETTNRERIAVSACVYIVNVCAPCKHISTLLFFLLCLYKSAMIVQTYYHSTHTVEAKKKKRRGFSFV